MKPSPAVIRSLVIVRDAQWHRFQYLFPVWFALDYFYETDCLVLSTPLDRKRWCARVRWAVSWLSKLRRSGLLKKNGRLTVKGEAMLRKAEQREEIRKMKGE